MFTFGTTDDYRNFNRPPVAYVRFQTQPTSGSIPPIVQFTDMSTGFPTTWNWTFGDGNASTMQSPLHIYTAVGTYTVSLNVTNADRFNLTVKPDYIT